MNEQNFPSILLYLMPVLPFVLLFAGLFVFRFRQQNSFKRSLADTGLVFVASLLVLLVAELALRTLDYDPWKRYDMYQKDGYYHLVPDGRGEKKIHDERAKLITEEINGEPFWYFEGRDWNSFHGRGAEPVKVKPDLRIVWIGNSIIFGSGVEVKDTFIEKIAGKMSAGGESVEGVNLAVPGYNLTNCKIALKRALPKLESDLLIVGLWDGGMYNTKLIDGVLYSADVEVIADQKIINTLPFDVEDVARLARVSRVFGMVTTAFGVLGFDYQKRSISNTDKMLRDLDEIKQLAGKLNIALKLLWLPPLDRPFEVQLKDPNPKLNSKVIKVVHFEAVKKYAAQNQIPLLDLRQLLLDLNVEDIRLDPCCHYNEKGHDIISKRLLDWITINRASF